MPNAISPTGLPQNGYAPISNGKAVGVPRRVATPSEIWNLSFGICFEFRVSDFEFRDTRLSRA